MELRDATFDDFPFLLDIMREVHDESVFKGMVMNEAIVQRNFVVAMSFGDGYAKVIEHKGRIVGGLVGMIANNQFGIRCAQDLFNHSLAGTDRLIKDFLRWAQIRDSQFVLITDLTGNPRYVKLCRTLGLEAIGTNLMKVM